MFFGNRATPPNSGQSQPNRNNGRVLIQSCPPNFREKFRVSPRTILENFSGVDTQTAVLVSTAEVWISAPDTQHLFFLFSGYPQLTLVLFFCRETKSLGYFPEMPVTKIMVSAPAPYKNPTVANPFSPYSIQKRPEPQICPKFVPIIVFRGSNQGGPEIVKNLKKN